MLWNSINFWRITAVVLFIAVLALLFPYLGTSPRFVLESSDMQVVNSPEYGALFTFAVSNEGRGGDAYVTCRVYLNERGGDSEEDYTVLGINSGETDSGELFIQLRPDQTVHDWRVEID